MPAASPDVDPEFLEELTVAAQARTILSRLGKAVSFWEALSLTQAQPALMREQVQRDSGIRTAVVDGLDHLRKTLGPLAEKFRALLARLPLVPKDPAHLEMTIAFTLLSENGRAAATKWADFPDLHSIEAADRMRKIEKMVWSFIKALETRGLKVAEPKKSQTTRRVVKSSKPTTRRIVKEEPAPAAHNPTIEEALFGLPPPNPATPPAGELEEAHFEPVPEPPPKPLETALPHGVDPEILDEIRRVEECRRIFQETHQEIEVWEVFCLVMNDRQEIKKKLREILNAKREGEGTKFNVGALELFDKLLEMRTKYHRFVGKLRAYVADLPVGHFGKETMEMALGFVVASRLGRETAEQWLEEPKRYRAEAAGRLESVINKTIRYQTALRTVPATD